MTGTPIPVERDCPHCGEGVRAWFMPDGKPRDPFLEVDCPNCDGGIPFDPPGEFLNIELVSG